MSKLEPTCWTTVVARGKGMTAEEYCSGKNRVTCSNGVSQRSQWAAVWPRSSGAKAQLELIIFSFWLPAPLRVL